MQEKSLEANFGGLKGLKGLRGAKGATRRYKDTLRRYKADFRDTLRLYKADFKVAKRFTLRPSKPPARILNIIK